MQTLLSNLVKRHIVEREARSHLRRGENIDFAACITLHFAAYILEQPIRTLALFPCADSELFQQSLYCQFTKAANLPTPAVLLDKHARLRNADQSSLQTVMESLAKRIPPRIEETNNLSTVFWRTKLLS